MKFTVLNKDSKARTALIELKRGTIYTPTFIPVASQGTVKAISPDELIGMGAEIIICNTYHLYIRPGHKTINELGGLHKFMSWDKPIITDSGGFQVYSLSPLRRIEEEGVSFKSHLDGSMHFIGPKEATEIQKALGADIIMAFDECPPYPSTYEYTLKSLILTSKWAKRCKELQPLKQAIFGIIQGGFYKELREKSADDIINIGFDGYAVGGVSVGEPKTIMHETIHYTAPLLPKDKLRYLMGIGDFIDILEAVEAGFDMFDCVFPTRTARNGTLFTNKGRISIKREEFKMDNNPLDPDCKCYTCQNFSKAYLRHLFQRREILSMRLNTLHNLYFYLTFFKKMREAINQKKFREFKKKWLNVFC